MYLAIVAYFCASPFGHTPNLNTRMQQGIKKRYFGFGLHCLISLQIAQCIQRKLDQI